VTSYESGYADDKRFWWLATRHSSLANSKVKSYNGAKIGKKARNKALSCAIRTARRTAEKAFSPLPPDDRGRLSKPESPTSKA